MVDPDVIVVTNVVPAGNDKDPGATPSTIPSVVGFEPVILRIIYPVADAPVAGKPAIHQYKLIWVDENGAALKPITAETGELESVRKFPSGLNPVPSALTAYPA